MLIHCKEGARRGPFAAAAWLMAKTGRPMQEVVRFLEQLRCLVHLGHGMKDTLKYHERGLAHLFFDLGAAVLQRPLPAVLSRVELLNELRVPPASGQVPVASPAGQPSSGSSSGAVKVQPDPPASGQSSASDPPASGQVPQDKPAAQSPASGQVPVVADPARQSPPGPEPTPASGQDKQSPASDRADWGGGNSFPDPG